jgi:hypothetical protein
MRMSRWIRWRIGDRFSVWHRVAERTRGRDIRVVDASGNTLSAAALRIEHREMIPPLHPQTSCGTPIPHGADIETADVPSGLYRCMFCLRLFLGALPPAAGGSPITSRLRFTSRRPGRRFDAVPDEALQLIREPSLAAERRGGKAWPSSCW